MTSTRETVSRALVEAQLCLHHTDADALTEARRWLRVAAGELDALVSRENARQAKVTLEAVLRKRVG